MTGELNPQPHNGRFSAFRYRDFRLFWASLFISNTGTWMQMTAVNWLLYELTQSPSQLGINDGWFFDGVRRTPETATPTRLEAFLKDALPEEVGR